MNIIHEVHIRDVMGLRVFVDPRYVELNHSHEWPQTEPLSPEARPFTFTLMQLTSVGGYG